MLKASALYYAVILSLLIAIIMASLIMVAYHHRLELEALYIQEKLEWNATSGMNILLAASTSEERELDLYEEDAGSHVKLSSANWGLFKLSMCAATSGVHTFNKAAITGSLPDDKPLALYLADQNRPLSLCGNTVIKGKAFLPEAGVKRAYIEGQNYTGAQLVYGETQTSAKTLPAINKELIDACYAKGQTLATAYDNIMTFKGGMFSDSLYNSFFQPTVLFAPQGPVKFGSSAYLKGNIIILSAFPVIFSADAEVNEVQVYAPFISFEDNFKGSVHAFATDSMVVGNKAELQYPSGLSLLNKDSKSTVSYITIKEDARCAGVIFIDNDLNKGASATLTIEKDAEIKGFVYVNGSVELKGKISGSLYCSRFYLRTPSSVYENYLLNATIDAQALPKYFVNNSLVPSANPQQVIKWLY